VHGRFSELRLPVNWIAADILRIEEGSRRALDVIPDEAAKQSQRVECQCLANVWRNT